MTDGMSRADFLKMVGVGGLVFATGLPGFGSPAKGEDFFFVQLSDTHWGFEGAKANPDAAGTLPKAIDAVNGLTPQPDFVIFTGDLTHNTDDPGERRKRMAAFKAHAARLKAAKVLFMPGEHDAAMDHGEAWREAFGESRYAFTHKGIHFIALDNVSQEGSVIGEAQLGWFGSEVAKVPKDAPLVVFAHRPLFDLYPDWDWHTTDGGAALALLKDHRHVTVFYGHIHQEHHFATDHIQHHAATSLIFPLPAPGSQPKRAPVPWDPQRPYLGLGFRQIREVLAGKAPAVARQEVTELPLSRFLPAAAAPAAAAPVMTTRDTRTSLRPGEVRDYRKEGRFFLTADDRGIYALTAICTHNGCTVNAQGEDGFGCPCHDSQYDRQGLVTEGPAKLPLRHFRVTEPEPGGFLEVDLGVVVEPGTRL